MNTSYDNDMQNTNRPRRKRRTRSAGARFLRVLLVTLGALLFLTASGLFVYGRLMGRDADLRAVAEALGSNLKDAASVTGMFTGVPEHTNFLILGTDEDGTRTDVMMAGTFNSKDETISLISMPRDTYTVMPEVRRNILTEHNVWPPAPSSGVMKLNAVHHYASEKYGAEFAVKQVEEILGIEIQYYVKIDLEAFRFIVDEIDGVEFDVPRRMYYSDPLQGLSIDLQPGLQTLTGKQAEGLVRFRSYANGDLDRAVVQQAFIKALATQLLQKDKFLSNAPAMMETLVTYVQTNFNPVDLPKYLTYAKGLNTDSIFTYTLPGVPDDSSGTSYFLHDAAATAELAAQVFYGAGISETEAKPEASTGKSIQVLNGGDIAGLAGRTRDILRDAGFTVNAVGDHTGSQTAHTRILVKHAGGGADLQPLLPGSQIEVNPSQLGTYDIVIILGTDAE